MSARLNLSIGIGTLAVMLIMSFGNLYFTNQGKEQSQHNNRDIESIRLLLTDFIKDRNIAFNQTFIKINSVIEQTNETQSRLLNISQKQFEQDRQLLELAKNQSIILYAQIQNEKNIIGNLTDHRIIQNLSRDEAEQRQNETLEAVKGILNNTKALTGPEYDKLADQKVQDIIGNITELIKNQNGD